MSRHVQQRLQNRLIRSRLFQRLIGSIGADSERSLWIFILGCYNSGTTLIYEMLRSNPGIASLPWEGSRLTHLFADPGPLGWPRMWQKCLPEIQAKESGLNEDAARKVKKQWKWASTGSQPIFVEKSITNAIRIPFLAQHFRPAFFIHIVRNGYAVSEGIRRKGVPSSKRNPEQMDRYPIDLCAQQWVKANNIIERELSGQNHVRIRYEDLCADTSNTLKKITDACPLISQEGIYLDIPDKLKVHGEFSGVINQNEAAIKRLDKSDIKLITTTARDTLKRYDYPALD